MLLTLVGEKGLFVGKIAVAVVAKDAGKGGGGRALLLAPHGLREWLGVTSNDGSDAAVWAIGKLGSQRRKEWVSP